MMVVPCFCALCVCCKNSLCIIILLFFFVCLFVYLSVCYVTVLKLADCKDEWRRVELNGMIEGNSLCLSVCSFCTTFKRREVDGTQKNTRNKEETLFIVGTLSQVN